MGRHVVSTHQLTHYQKMITMNLMAQQATPLGSRILLAATRLSARGSSTRMPLFLVTMLTCALAGFACQAAARESTPTTSPLSLSVEVVTQDLAVGDSRLALVVLADGRPLSEGAVHLVFYYLQDPQPVVRAEADAVPRLDQHEHANLADHVDLPFYVAPVRFDRAGPWGMEAQVNQPGSATRVARTRLDVREQPLAPAIGSPAPRSASKTLRTAPPEELSSAVPIDPELYGLSIAEAIETGQPLVVAFATPAFCQSRTCGPQLHVIEHLKERYREQVNFIHVEVYDKPQEATRDLRSARPSPTVTEWRLPSEPWVFVVDGQGSIAARFEGFTTVDELEPELRQVLARP